MKIFIIWVSSAKNKYFHFNEGKNKNNPVQNFEKGKFSLSAFTKKMMIDFIIV